VRSQVPLRQDAFGDSNKLQRPLNDALSDLRQRVSLLEALAGVQLLPDFEFETQGAPSPSSAPFPLRATTPANFTPQGLLVVGLRNLTTNGPTGIENAATTVFWAPDVDGRTLLLQYISGLQAATRYRITLAALRRGVA
jgi:hypothetical protein